MQSDIHWARAPCNTPRWPHTPRPDQPPPFSDSDSANDEPHVSTPHSQSEISNTPRRQRRPFPPRHRSRIGAYARHAEDTLLAGAKPAGLKPAGPKPAGTESARAAGYADAATRRRRDELSSLGDSVLPSFLLSFSFALYAHIVCTYSHIVSIYISWSSFLFSACFVFKQQSTVFPTGRVRPYACIRTFACQIL